ncbi:MAG TPA: XRE family transcriptional regulator [Rhodospirillales bacterium]|nr:XRE family transcriptional regulator [Rhodospirillales bacterium]
MTARPHIAILHPDAVRIREVLVRRRRQLGMSQEELDERLGCAERMVSKWECGRHAPTLGTLVAWAEALGLRIELREQHG